MKWTRTINEDNVLYTITYTEPELRAWLRFLFYFKQQSQFFTCSAFFRHYIQRFYDVGKDIMNKTMLTPAALMDMPDDIEVQQVGDYKNGKNGI